MRAIRPIALACALVTLAESAWAADDPANVAAAESLFQEGLRFKAQRRWADACRSFARSEELSPAVGTLLNLGECHEQLHELAQAWLAYRQAITVADASGGNRADRARREAARVEPRVPHLTIALATAPPGGMNVMRDDARIEPAALNAAVAIDPGHHVVTVTAPERRPWSTTVDIAEGQSITVTIPALEPATAPAAPAPAPAPTPGSPRRAIGIGMEIGGGVILAAGLVTGTIALAQWRSVEDACPNGGCPRAIAKEQQHDVDVARTWATFATVGLIGGATILAAGIALHLTAPKDHVSLAPVVGRETAGFMLVWRR